MLYSYAYKWERTLFFLSKRRWNKEALIIIANNKHFLRTIYMIIPVKAYQRIHHFKACCALFRFGLKEKIIWSNWVIQQSYFSFTLIDNVKNALKSSIMAHVISGSRQAVWVQRFDRKYKCVVKVFSISLIENNTGLGFLNDLIIFAQ